MKLTDEDKAFNRGVAVAAGIAMSAHGEEVVAEEILRAAGLETVKALRASGVDWYDIRTLAPVLSRPQWQIPPFPPRRSH